MAGPKNQSPWVVERWRDNDRLWKELMEITEAERAMNVVWRPRMAPWRPRKVFCIGRFTLILERSYPGVRVTFWWGG